MSEPTRVLLARVVNRNGDRVVRILPSERKPPPAPMPRTRIPEVMSGWCRYCSRYNRPCGRHED